MLGKGVWMGAEGSGVIFAVSLNIPQRKTPQQMQHSSNFSLSTPLSAATSAAAEGTATTSQLRLSVSSPSDIFSTVMWNQQPLS